MSTTITIDGYSNSSNIILGSASASIADKATIETIASKEGYIAIYDNSYTKYW